MGSTTETVVELFFLTDREGGAFLVMKRAASLIVLACFFQPDSAVNQLDNIGASQQVIDKGLGDLACHVGICSLNYRIAERISGLEE